MYCSMIHGGLHIDITPDGIKTQHCCLNPVGNWQSTGDLWHDVKFQPLRQLNQQNDVAPGCYDRCIRLEQAGEISFRQGMNQGLGIDGKYNVSGPARIDLKFDVSCNLACRICGSHSSTLWQRELGLPVKSQRSSQQVIDLLKTLDLKNLRQVVFCGGETLLGTAYWTVAEWLVDHVPNAKQQLTLCFQTNGTQPVPKRFYSVIEKSHLVKLHVSLDDVGRRFEYQRWPAFWGETVNNLQTIRANVPSNVMFVVETTISIFNILYLHDIKDWVTKEFATNREGDLTNHTMHYAHGTYNLNLTPVPLRQAIADRGLGRHLPSSAPQLDLIPNMIQEIQLHDQRRRQDFRFVFPELAKFYREWL